MVLHEHQRLVFEFHGVSVAVERRRTRERRPASRYKPAGGMRGEWLTRPARWQTDGGTPWSRWVPVEPGLFAASRDELLEVADCLARELGYDE